MRLLVSILLFSTACFAQFPLSFGIKGGVPLTDSFQDNGTAYTFGDVRAHTTSRNYIIGPMVELRLPFHLAIEADALYLPLNVVGSAFSAPQMPQVLNSFGGNYGSWEFPIVAKYRFSFPIVKPYVEAGPSFRAMSAQPLSRLSSDGVTIGAGVDFHVLILHIAPEFRYTRWGSDAPMTGDPSIAESWVKSYQNQVEFLVGLTF